MSCNGLLMLDAEVSADLQQQRLCLTDVARVTALQLAEEMPAAFPATMRSQLFNLFSEWSMDASPGMKSGEDAVATRVSYEEGADRIVAW